MNLRIVFIFGSIALACLMQVGYGETQPPRLTGAELADQIVRGKLPPIEELSVVEKEVLVEELVRRFQEYRRSKRDDRPHSSSVIRDVIHPLMVLGHRETFKHVLDDYRGGWRTRFDMDIGFIQQPELLVMLMDDYLFVEEEIDWTQYDNYSRLYMKTIHQVAAEVLLRYVRTQDRMERLGQEVEIFISGVLLAYEMSVQRHPPPPKKLTDTFRQFWKDNREYFLAEEYERVTVPARK